MRIACANHHRQIVGGTESYLNRLIPALVSRGHQVSFWHEGAAPPGAPAIEAPEVFAVDAGAAARLRDWRPRVIFNNGLMGMEWESALPSIAPVVHYAHNYYGTCISGEKTRKSPSPLPCPRIFGTACLAQYLPRRCGGLNPLTMWRDYRLQGRRLAHLRGCSAIVTASRHIEEEYRRHGLAPLYRAPLFVQPAPPPEAMHDRVLFCGRMMPLKGGALLLDAIPEIERSLGRPVDVVFAGDGPARAQWEARRGKARFTGWIPQSRIRDLNAGVLAMPSLWPEPFGLAGLELGLPVAAFSVGGIPDWLHEGINGHLAPPASVSGLARAVAACLETPAHWRALAEGAARIASSFSLERHLDALLPILESAR